MKVVLYEVVMGLLREFASVFWLIFWLGDKRFGGNGNQQIWTYGMLIVCWFSCMFFHQLDELDVIGWGIESLVFNF